MQHRRRWLLALLLLGCFQLGRLAERHLWPCRLRPVLTLVAPLLPQPPPDAGLCDLLLSLPG